MKKSFLIIGLLTAVILMVGGCDGTVGMKDCGSDYECFTDAFLNCTPAKLTMSVGEGEYVTETYSEIRGGTKTACKFYMKYIKAPIKEYEGTYMECVVPVVEGAEPDPDACSGTLIDLMEQQMSVLS